VERPWPDRIRLVVKEPFLMHGQPVEPGERITVSGELARDLIRARRAERLKWLRR